MHAHALSQYLAISFETWLEILSVGGLLARSLCYWVAKSEDNFRILIST